MAKQIRTIGISITQIALSIYLVITALCLFPFVKAASISSAEVQALTNIFNKWPTLELVVNIIIGVILFIGGLMLCVKAFTELINPENKGIDFGKFDDIVRRIIICLWIIVTIVALIYYAKPDFTDSNKWQILHWFLSLAKNALIIGGLLTLKDGR